MRWMAVMLLLAAGCGQAASDTDRDLAEAMCSDLDAGASMFQMYSQAVTFYEETRDTSADANQLAAAELMDFATTETCPQHRDAWTATAPYEQWIQDD